MGLWIVTYGQNVSIDFNDTLVYENFKLNTSAAFPQKFNTVELSIFENGTYRIHRMAPEGKSILYLKEKQLPEQYELSSTLTLSKMTENAAGGIVCHASSTPNSALFFEINTNRKFRILKLIDNELLFLSGDAKDNGWVKNQAIEKLDPNVITLKTANGYSDFYINGTFIQSIYDFQLQAGKVGFVVGPKSEIVVEDLLIKHAQKKLITIDDTSPTNKTIDNQNNDFKEVILLFKTKIDKQQLTIAELQKEVDKYRSMLNYDTTLISRASGLEKENAQLASKLDSTTQALLVKESRLAYLESMREDIEKGSNGDLILNLTLILAELKKENKQIQQEKIDYQNNNEQLKEDNKVLLREIERLKNLINTQN